MLVVKNSRSISDLYTGANLSIYSADRKQTCHTCDEVSNAAVRKAGEFSYNFENDEVLFSEGNM